MLKLIITLKLQATCRRLVDTSFDRRLADISSKNDAVTLCVKLGSEKA